MSTAVIQQGNPIVRQAQYLRRVAFVLDTETTGSNRTNDEVIELGMVRASDGGVLIDQRFRPSKKIEPFAYRVHKISDASLRNEPRFSSRWSEYFGLLNGAVVVGWNVAYDRQMIEATCKRYNLEVPSVEWVDLMPLYRSFRRAAKNCKLSDACAEMGVKEGTHSAKSDALAAARVLFRMADAEPEGEAQQEQLFSPPVTHEWEESEISEWYGNAEDVEPEEEAPAVAGSVQEGDAEAFIADDGSLRIPVNAKAKFKWWAGGQTIWKTLVSIGATTATIKRYAAKSNGPLHSTWNCKGEEVELEGLSLCTECGWYVELPTAAPQPLPCAA